MPDEITAPVGFTLGAWGGRPKYICTDSRVCHYDTLDRSEAELHRIQVHAHAQVPLSLPPVPPPTQLPAPTPPDQ